MKTLYKLMIAATLVSTIQVASATENNNSGSHNQSGTYGTTYGGYWRTHDGYGGWKKDDSQMRVPHWINNWNDCFYECKGDSNCKGIEFQSKRGNNVCEIHYDAFAHCEQKSSSNGSHGKRSTCWVKSDYSNMDDYYQMDNDTNGSGG